MTSTNGSRLRPQRPPKPSPQIAERSPLNAGITTPCQLRNSTQRISRIMTIEAPSTPVIFGMISMKYAKRIGMPVT